MVPKRFYGLIMFNHRPHQNKRYWGITVLQVACVPPFAHQGTTYIPRPQRCQHHKETQQHWDISPAAPKRQLLGGLEWIEIILAKNIQKPM